MTDRETLHCVCQDLQVQSAAIETERQRGGDRELDPHSYDQQVGSVSHRNKETTGMKQKDRPLQLSTACRIISIAACQENQVFNQERRLAINICMSEKTFIDKSKSEDPSTQKVLEIQVPLSVREISLVLSPKSYKN